MVVGTAVDLTVVIAEGVKMTGLQSVKTFSYPMLYSVVWLSSYSP